VGNLSVAPQNRQEDEDGTGHPSGSSGLLRLEASRTKVSQSSLKTGGGATWMMHAASSWRSREEKLKTAGRCDVLHWTLLPQLFCFHCIRP
jgi:hypothetical protein